MIDKNWGSGGTPNFLVLVRTLYVHATDYYSQGFVSLATAWPHVGAPQIKEKQISRSSHF